MSTRNKTNGEDNNDRAPGQTRKRTKKKETSHTKKTNKSSSEKSKQGVGQPTCARGEGDRERGDTQISFIF